MQLSILFTNFVFIFKNIVHLLFSLILQKNKLIN